MLFTVGEVALLRAAKPSSGLTVLVQALTAYKVLASGPAAAACQAPQDVAMSGEEAADVEVAAAPPAAALGAGAVPTSVQAHAWICLGKLCLTDEPLAKKCVPLFVMVSRAAVAQG